MSLGDAQAWTYGTLSGKGTQLSVELSSSAYNLYYGGTTTVDFVYPSTNNNNTLTLYEKQVRVFNRHRNHHPAGQNDIQRGESFRLHRHGCHGLIRRRLLGNHHRLYRLALRRSGCDGLSCYGELFGKDRHAADRRVPGGIHNLYAGRNHRSRGKVSYRFKSGWGKQGSSKRRYQHKLSGQPGGDRQRG